MAEIDFEITLQKLRIVQRNENSGDEPYLLFGKVLVDGSNVSAANLAAADPYVDVDGREGNLGADDHEPGDGALGIPSKLGRWSGTLRTIDDAPQLATDPQSGPERATLAMFVVGLEEDSTSSDDVIAAKRMLEDYVQTKLTSRLRKGEFDGSLQPNVALLTAKVTSIVEDSILKAWKMTPGTFPISLTQLATEGVDPDDYVGNGTLVYDFRTLRRLMGFPAKHQLVLEAEKKKDFEGRYVVHAEVRVTDVREQDPVKIAVGLRSGGRIDVVARGDDHGYYLSTWNGTTAWSGWSRIGNGTFLSGPALVATGPEQLLVFGRGGDQRLWASIYDGGWSGWMKFDELFAAGPALAATTGGGVALVIRAANDRYKLKRRPAGSPWTAWMELGAAEFVTAPGVCARGSILDVVGVGLDRRGYHVAIDDGDVMQWGPMGSGTLTSAIAVVADGPNLHAFARGDDRNVYHAVLTGGKWSDWMDDVDAGPSKSATILSAPAVVSRAPGRFDLFAVGDDRRIYHTTWDGTSWTGWLTDTPAGKFV